METEHENEGYLDIDCLKMPYESELEWGLRKCFLVAHQDKFPKDRLLCLSRCFVNIEVYRNRYPDEVMIQVRELTEDIEEVTRFREKINERRRVNFVQTSNSSSAPSKERGQEVIMTGFVRSTTKFQDTENLKKETCVYSSEESSTAGLLQQQGMRDASSEAVDEYRYNAWDTAEVESSKILQKFYKLGKMLQMIQSSQKNSQVNIASCALHNAAERLHMAIKIDCMRAAIGQHTRICSLQIDSVHVATSDISVSKKKAKVDAYVKAVDLLYKRYLRIVQFIPQKRELQGSDTPFPLFPPVPYTSETDISSSFQHLDMTQAESFSSYQPNFDTTLDVAVSNISPLAQETGQEKQTDCPTNQGPPSKRGRMQSLDFNQVKPLRNFVIVEQKYPDRDLNPAVLLRSSADFCQMNVSFQHEIQGDDRHCVLKIEDQVLADLTGPYEQTAAESVAAEQALEALRLICHTIQIQDLANTEDSNLPMEVVLGDNQQSSVIPDSNIGNKFIWAARGMHTKMGQNGKLLQSVKSVLRNYAKSDNEGELTFSSEFHNTERALIHMECQELGLKCKSLGKGTDRFMIVSREKNITQILGQVMRQEEEISKYVGLVIPPSGEH